MMQLNAKTAVLTGAAGGIGQALATELDRRGAKLILAGRNPAKLATLNNSLQQRHTIVAADLTTANGRAELMRVCNAQPGGVDLLINNAGISQFAMLGEQTEIEAMISTNLTLPIMLCQLLLPLFSQRPQASIVNIGSTFGSVGYPGFSPYSATKFGLRGFSQALRRELADSSISVLYIAPRATKTTINDDRVTRMNTQLGNSMDSVERVVEQIVEAITKQKKTEVYLGWPEKFYVKVNALFPAVVDHSLNKQLPQIDNYCKLT